MRGVFKTDKHQTTLAELHAKISRDLEVPMQEIYARMKSNEATPEEWNLWRDYRRNQLLYPTSAEQMTPAK